MTNWIRRIVFAAALLFIVPHSAFALGVIVDGAVSFEYFAFTGATDPATDIGFTGAGTGGDQLYASWWFYRVSGDTAESVLPDPGTESYVGNEANLGWSDVDARGLFDADLKVTIMETTVDPLFAAGANLFQELTISNRSLVNPLVIEIFFFADLDLGGSSFNDSATLVNGFGDIEMSITDGGGNDYASLIGYNADLWQVNPYAGLGNQLTDATAQDFNNTGLDATNFDFTGGFQWQTVTIGAGSSETFLTQMSLGAPPVPEPVAGLLIGAALAAISLRRRA